MITKRSVSFKFRWPWMMSWSLNVFFAFRCLFNFRKNHWPPKIPKIKPPKICKLRVHACDCTCLSARIDGISLMTNTNQYDGWRPCQRVVKIDMKKRERWRCPSTDKRLYTYLWKEHASQKCTTDEYYVKCLRYLASLPADMHSNLLAWTTAWWLFWTMINR